MIKILLSISSTSLSFPFTFHMDVERGAIKEENVRKNASEWEEKKGSQSLHNM